MAAHSHKDSAVPAPVHPVPQLQGPFEESMLESIQDDPDADIYLDPVVRRNTLLEAPTYTRVVAGRWKQKPGERFHPLWKLIAQISFGIHLLAEGMAKSEDEVMQILQAHVDEIDGFLERTTQDFDLAQDDIQERLRCLKLPLSHPATFDKMLEDRNFRLSIVEGNEKIEHIVERTTQAMKDSVKDVQKGFDSTSCLEIYLRKLDAMWIRQSIEHEAVFVAMLGNVEGWRKAFTALHLQGGKLGGSLKKLTDIINEMQARAGEVSRRLLHQARGFTIANEAASRHSQNTTPSSLGRSTPTSRFQTASTKKLPNMPERPPLRQAPSNDSVKSQSSSRMNHLQDSLRKQAGSPSLNAQTGMPPARQVKTGPTPRVIQMGTSSSARVHSMVPSLVESVSSAREPSSAATPSVSTLPIGDEDSIDRYFPPVELPAHVPEETMRYAPMSKQNRLSLGFGLNQSKRNSRLGAPAAALVDLLRKPSSHRLSSSSKTTPPIESLHESRRTSVVDSNTAENGGIYQQIDVSVEQIPSVHERETSTFSKNNVRRPKKGVQHWFDAHEDDLTDDDKFSVQEDPTPQTATITTKVLVRSYSPSANTPGTPSWAIKTFTQSDQRRAELKQGIFGSHPPGLPPGSPPQAQEFKMPNPLSVVAPRRSASHTSSAGTLGEPGPAVTPSEAGSIQARTNGNYEEPSWKRASSAAPEVVIDNNPPPVPVAPKQFLVEMEGSSPSGIYKVPPPTSRSFAIELEAPQQYFKLPPRPETVKNKASIPPQELTGTPCENVERPAHYEQYFKLPTRESAVRVSRLPPAPLESDLGSQSIAVKMKTVDEVEPSKPADPSVGLKLDDPGQSEPQQISREESESEQEPQVKSEPETESKPESVVVADSYSALTSEEFVTNATDAQSVNNGQHETVPLLEAVVYNEAVETPKEDIAVEQVATPQIPLPPSPSEESEVVSEEEVPQSSPTGPLFLLPAVAYKAAASPKPSLEPLQTQLPAVAYTPPIPEAQEHMQTDETSQQSPGRQSSSSPSVRVMSEVLPEVREVEEVQVLPSIGQDRQLQRSRKPAELKHTRNTSSHGSQNGWKAFFTGQPSPVGSNLSIRSIQRDSIIEPRSPALLSPASATKKFTGSPIATSAKDVVWYNRPFDEVKPVTRTLSSLASEKSKEGEGLGITGLATSEMKKQALRAN